MRFFFDHFFSGSYIRRQLCVSFKLTSIYNNLRLILVYPSLDAIKHNITRKADLLKLAYMLCAGYRWNHLDEHVNPLLVRHSSD